MFDEATVAIAKEKQNFTTKVIHNDAVITNIDNLVKESWKKIAPFWPLKNLIAVNPLQGFEDLPIETALLDGATFFEQKHIPEPMHGINRESIKWLQAFFDEGQATIAMPLRHAGLYKSWKKLACFDPQLHSNNRNKQQWLLELPESSEAAIIECMLKLKIPRDKQVLFLTLLLTTLPGWAAYIRYRTNWADSPHKHPASEADYLAIRIIITCMLWDDASKLIGWHNTVKRQQATKSSPLSAIQKAEAEFIQPLLHKLSVQTPLIDAAPDAQVIFCIDVRSEPYRRALESVGNYATYGFAGFFGLPVRIHDTTTGESYSSCPVLIKPKHTVDISPSCVLQAAGDDHKEYKRLTTIKALYQSLKYNFTTAFAVVELLGVAAGVWMLLKTIVPNFANTTRATSAKYVRRNRTFTPSLVDITTTEQAIYAESALRAIGLTKSFAPLVVLCGHGSSTQNNAYATALDCGACGGRHGASNAKILAKILNTQSVRDKLTQSGINIPNSTSFIAAQHNTTTDQVELYPDNICNSFLENKLNQLKLDLKQAGAINSQRRCKQMNLILDKFDAAKQTKIRSVDWAQVRPEWALARNAAFIVGPRALTKSVDLDGRVFLHSYDYLCDNDGAILTAILTAPMVVAQWINSQYLFSTLDNVAYGSGSKITKNIIGKFAVMQGNASDLMTGLPLQSVHSSDKHAFHAPTRLTTIVYAPRNMIDTIISKQPVLQKLFKHGWVMLVAIEPDNLSQQHILGRDLKWNLVIK